MDYRLEYRKLCDGFDVMRADRVRDAVSSGLVCVSRTGFGVDVHPYVDGGGVVSCVVGVVSGKGSVKAVKPCVIGCVEWDCPVEVLGHSDGDLVAHAICDALLSACGLGDLGVVFGVDLPEMKNASGEFMLRKCLDLLGECGWFVDNVSVQFVGSVPKISPRQFEVSYRLSSILNAPVSFGATTTDGLGFVGRGEGLVAFATCSVSRFL